VDFREDSDDADNICALCNNMDVDNKGQKQQVVTFCNLDQNKEYAQVSSILGIKLPEKKLGKYTPSQEELAVINSRLNSNDDDRCDDFCNPSGCKFEKGTIYRLDGVVEVQPPQQNGASPKKGGKPRKTIRRKSKKRKTWKMRKTRK
jgi:hypothetical protein